ncbi:SDR family NAD(P)-dependent oxidoreductase [Nonomuraea sp. NPDC002799]
MKLAGTTALITGASGGIGQATARRLAREGVRLVLSGRRADVLADLAGELDARAITADLTRRDAVIELMKCCGPVDILVVSAGLSYPAAFADHHIDEMDDCLDVNLRAPMVLARLAAEQMIAGGRGHLVFMCSMTGKTPLARTTLDNATKHGLRGFAHAARADLAQHGIGVSVICPAFVSEAGMSARSPVPLPKWLRTRSPEQVADAVCRAIRANIAETDVAAFPVRLAGMMAGLSPAMWARVRRAVGADRHAQAVVDGIASRPL